MNWLRQAASKYILKRKWIEAEILPYILRYVGITTLLDPALSAAVAALGLYLREGNPLEDLHQLGNDVYDRKDLELPGNRQIALPSILMRYFCSELTIQQFEALLIAKQAENDKELDVAATACRRMKRAKQTLARLPHPAASSTINSAPLAPAPLGNTPPAHTGYRP